MLINNNFPGIYAGFFMRFLYLERYFFVINLKRNIMKKLIFLLVLLPFGVVGQNDLNKSAEEFVLGYFKMFENKQWDEVPKSLTDDCVFIGANYTPALYSTMLSNILRFNRENLISDKIEVKWINADAIGPNAAMVSIHYIENVERSNFSPRSTDNISIFLLVQNEGAWKIKKLIIQQSYPLLVDKQIDQMYQRGALGMLARFDGGLGQMSSVFMYILESSMKGGATPAETGKKIGARFAKTWDQSKGFEGLANGFAYGLQTGSNYVEIMERSETTFKARFRLFPVSPTWEVTPQNILDMYKGMWDEIVGYMGGTYTLTDDGKFWTVTLNKK